MVKKNVLTPVLAGVLGVTVAGSGVLYVLDNKDSKDAEKDAKDGVTDTVDGVKVGETAFARVQDKVEATAEKVERAIKGELDFAYNGKAEITFGPAVTDNFGVALKPITIEAKTRQKAGMSEADISAAYDSKTLATLNFIADSNNKKIYIKVPELSGAYLTATEDELRKLLDSSGNMMNQFRTVNTSGTATAMASAPMQGMDPEKLKEMLDQIDVDALLKDLEEYVDVVKSKIPEGTDKGTISGDINGNSYNYTVKSVNITGKVISDIASAVGDKLKDDQTMKDTFTKMGMDVNQYSQMIDTMSKSMSQSKDVQENADKTVFTVDVFYLGDDPTGIELDMGGSGKVKMVALNSKDVLGLDFSAVSNGKEALSAKGAFKNDGGTINGDFKIVANASGDTSSEINLSVKDLKEQGEMFSGSINAEFKSNKESVGFAVDSASTADKLDVTFKMTQDSKEGFTVKLTGQKTDATDVELPTGDAYQLDEQGLKKYMETVDENKLKERIKDALGDELWNKFNSNGYDD